MLSTLQVSNAYLSTLCNASKKSNTWNQEHAPENPTENIWAIVKRNVGKENLYILMNSSFF